MLGSRKVLICLFVLGLVALAAPVVALANGGSAGDQQYTDPLSGTHSPSTTTTQAPPPSTSTSNAPPPASSPTPAPPTSSAAPTTTATAPATATPTATTAATTGTSTLSAAGARQLPYTGYDGRLAAAVGFALVLGGIGLRRKLRHD